MTLPADIKQVFFETIIGDKPLPELEQWVYSDSRLENILPLFLLYRLFYCFSIYPLNGLNDQFRILRMYPMVVSGQDHNKTIVVVFDQVRVVFDPETTVCIFFFDL